jgi:hypothetical protein
MDRIVYYTSEHPISARIKPSSSAGIISILGLELQLPLERMVTMLF